MKAGHKEIKACQDKIEIAIKSGQEKMEAAIHSIQLELQDHQTSGRKRRVVCRPKDTGPPQGT
jgi:hypothetical protein